MNTEEKETANEDVSSKDNQPPSNKTEPTESKTETLTEEQKKDPPDDLAATAKGDNQVKELEVKFAEMSDKYIRLYSEFDNYKKRNLKERVEWAKFAGEGIFKSVLAVMDDFERAMKANAEAKDVKAVNEGVSLIYQKMKTTLAQKGLEEMVSIGQEFNPDIHDAVTNIATSTEEQKGKVIEEIEKGYLLNGKVIRHAKVIVGA